jgi:hypothetical protein
MAVSFKVVDNRTSISKKIKQLQDELVDYRTFFLQGMATEVIFASPVDTGTYITNHTISNNTPGGSASSVGKPKGQDYGTYAQIGLDKLFSDIDALGDNNLTSVRLTNISEHAGYVEYELGYAPYTTTRNKANVISAEAAAKAKGSA